MEPPHTTVASWIARRPWTVLGTAVVVSVALALGLPRLGFETSQEGLIGEDHPISVQNAEFQRDFGGEAMIAVFSADDGRRIDDLFTSGNRDELRRLEEALRASGRFHSVIGPVTGLDLGLRQFAIGDEMIAAARARIEREASPADAAETLALVDARMAGSAPRAAAALEAGAALGLDDPASLDNPAMVAFLLYDDETGTTTRPALRDAFPDTAHALLVARLPGNLPLDEANEAVAAFEAAVADVDLDGFEVFATGSPELIRDINDYLQSGMVTLGLLAALVMVVVLFAVFRVRWRLLSMAIVVIGAVWGFGLMGYVGVPLTLITISGLPILIGLGVDFSIQVHNRFEEELALTGSPDGAVQRVLARLGPALVVAMLAAVAGFLSLQISDVPQIRQFGIMLALGIAALLVAATLVPLAILVLRERRGRPGAATLPGGGVLERGVRWLCFALQRRLVPVVVVGAVIVVAGLAVEGRFVIQTDPERWVAQDSETVEELRRLRVTAFSSELVVLVEAPDVTATEVLQWTQRFADAQIERHPDVLVRGASVAAVVAELTGAPPGQDEALVMLGGALDDPPTYDVAPADFVRSFVSADRRRAAIVFPIRNITLQERRALLDEMRADLDPPAGVSTAVAELSPPAGVTGVPTGLAAIGAEFVELLEANRVAMTWLALGAVGLCLLLWFRSVTMTVLPLVPVTIAVGLSALVTMASGRELSPLTSVTGPLVIATCTEFSVLILARYVEERRRGLDPAAAVDLGAVRIGRAFVASGLTVVGGFAVLGLSSYPLLRDFGILVALNVVVALVCALAVLPPLLMWADGNRRLTRFPPGASADPPAEPPVAPEAVAHAGGADGSSG